jgi:hypothetical protein
MAAIHNYKIVFKSLRSGTTYIVTVGGGEGDPIQLKGAANPFVTQEDDDEDMFVPLRTQTGSLSIIDDGYGDGDNAGTPFDWHDLQPATATERPVTLRTSSGGLRWQGYLQAQDFSGTLYGNPQERVFPIHCALSAMSGSMVETGSGIHNFAYIIRQAFSRVPDCNYTRFLFQGGSDARQWLLKKVMWQNFISEDSDGNVSAKYDYYQVMKDICQYWGWTARTYRNYVLFMCADDSVETNILTLTSNQLDSLADETSTSAGSISEAFSELTPGDIFTSVDNDEILVRGYSKATVHADVNRASNVMQFAPKVVEDSLESAGGYSWVGEDMRGYFTTPKVTTFSLDIMEGRGSNGGGFCRRQVYTSEEAETAETQDMMLLPSVDGEPGWVTGSVQIDWKRQMMYNAGRLELNGNVFQGYQIFDAKREDGWVVQMRLGIGTSRATAKWFSYSFDIDSMQVKAEWTDSAQSSFLANISNGKLNGLVCLDLRPFAFSKQYMSYIPIPDGDAMFGNLYIDVLGTEGMSFELGNLEVTYSRDRVEVAATGTRSRTMTVERKDRTEYTASNNNGSGQEWDVDNIFATDKDGKMAFGFGLLMNPDYTYMQQAPHGTTEQVPEQTLATRVANFWQRSRLMLRVMLDSDGLTVNPRRLININGGQYYPVSIGNNWHDNDYELLLIEV